MIQRTNTCIAKPVAKAQELAMSKTLSKGLKHSPETGDWISLETKCAQILQFAQVDHTLLVHNIVVPQSQHLWGKNNELKWTVSQDPKGKFLLLVFSFVVQQRDIS